MRSHQPPRAVAYWLLTCCALVYAMIVVGGITRLTHSGLSIVEWRPITGALPPLDEAQWQELFAKYRATPEFRLRNFDMQLAGFKGIFWWEYIHRLLGRVIGVAFLVPFVWFLAKRRLERPLSWQLAGIFLLGGLQGALGWYMVASGLVDDPRVSQFRLAAHLTLAFVIYGAMLWVAVRLLAPPRDTAVPPGIRQLALALVLLVLAMVVTGALVAGIRAGYAYNTFPLMNGHLVPPEIFLIDPWWKNFGYNMATVQFDHRLLAWGVAVLTCFAWWKIARASLARGSRLWSHALLATVTVQFALGVATLLSSVQIVLAALHQAGSVAVFTSAVGLFCVLQAAPRGKM
jgi:cytochrome c oxidase assembly protein subunit 15